MKAYEDTIRDTATEDAPWYVVPADNKWFTRVVVAAAIVETLDSLGLHYPKVDKARRKDLAAVRKLLIEGKRSVTGHERRRRRSLKPVRALRRRRGAASPDGWLLSRRPPVSDGLHLGRNHLRLDPRNVQPDPRLGPRAPPPRGDPLLARPRARSSHSDRRPRHQSRRRNAGSHRPLPADVRGRPPSTAVVARRSAPRRARPRARDGRAGPRIRNRSAGSCGPSSNPSRTSS